MKNLFFLGLCLLMIFSCDTDDANLNSTENQKMELESRAANKVTLCHITGNGSYHSISVNQNAVAAHLGHGDAYPGECFDNGLFMSDNCEVIDVSSVMDGCDDIDNDCDGEIDEDCCCFADVLQPIANINYVTYNPGIGYGRILYDDGTLITLGFPTCSNGFETICHTCFISNGDCTCEDYIATPAIPADQFDICLSEIGAIFDEWQASFVSKPKPKQATNKSQNSFLSDLP